MVIVWWRYGWCKILNILQLKLFLVIVNLLYFHEKKIDQSAIEDFYGLTSDLQKSSETGYILFYQSRDATEISKSGMTDSKSSHCK